jgi:hypothetical protein
MTAGGRNAQQWRFGHTVAGFVLFPLPEIYRTLTP